MWHRSVRRVLVLLGVCCVSAASAAAVDGADWPQFRGPGGLGVAESAGSLPAAWSDDRHIVWKTNLPGAGASSPITLGDRIYVTCYSGYGLNEDSPGNINDLRRHLVCLERAKGTILWQREIPNTQFPEQRFEGFLALHGYASSTPVTDGQRLYVFCGKSGVTAFDLQGNVLWQKSVGAGMHNWGSAASPVLVGNLVIVNASVEDGSLVALDRTSGEQVWRAGGMRRVWGTPLLVTLPAGPELVVSMQGEIAAFDPATGEKLWTCQGIDDYVCPSPIAHEGIVYAIGARQNTAMAVRAGGRGDVTQTHRLWSVGKGSNVSSPVYHEGYLYWMSESRGVAYCLDARDGKVMYEQRMEPRPDRSYASALLADGKIFYVTRFGGTYVVRASPRYELLAHNKIESDESVFNASPVVSRGELLLRSDSALYCIGN